MKTQGRIIKWDDNKGYGFITPTSGGKQVFIHISAFGQYRHNRPELNQVIDYTLSTDKQGRLRAENAVLHNGKRNYTHRKNSEVKLREYLQQRSRNLATSAAILAILFLFTMSAASILRKVQPSIPIFYILISFLTFAMYARDKRAAQQDLWRTPEKTLHMLSLLGGWPGALIAQQKLHHKSSKQSFLIIFSATIVLNILILSTLIMPNNRIIPDTIRSMQQVRISSIFKKSAKQRGHGHIHVYDSNGNTVKRIELD